MTRAGFKPRDARRDAVALAIWDGSFYVASRVGMAINQYPLTQPGAGSVYVSGLADKPEFILSL